ncbi:MAG: glycosyltransferase family 2 protein [Jejuia sp.]
MTVNPLISIIIPTYNRSKIIGATLNSVINQTYSNWECLVIDDGSTDETEQLMVNYMERDARFKYHKRPTNRPKGANACRNYGFELSKGSLINWFDSDDVLLPNKLEKQRELLRNSAYGFAICQSKKIYRNKGNKETLWNKNIHSNDVLNNYISFKISWQTGAVLYKKEFLEELQLKFDESLQQSQEYDFHIRLLTKNQNYAFDTEPLMVVYAHTDSISYSTENLYEKAFSSLGVKKKLLKNKDLELKRPTKIFLLSDMYRVFFQSTQAKNFKTAWLAYKHFLCAHWYIDIKTKLLFFKNFSFATVALLSYVFTGKGYRFFKLTIK